MTTIKSMDSAGTEWANFPPPSGASGSIWERNIIDLAEAGEPRFVRILDRHVRANVIKSDRARAVLLGNNGASDAA